MDKTKAILLLDDNSKKIIKTNVADFSLHNILFVNNLGEITDEMLASTKTVIILEGFLRTSTGLSDLRLFQALEGLQYIFIGQNEQLIMQIKPIAYTFNADISTLNYETVDAALYQDKSLEVTDSSQIDESREFAKLVCKSESDYDVRFVQLAQNYLACEGYIEYTQRQFEEQKAANTQLSMNNARINEENEILTQSYVDMLNKAHILNKQLKDYEHILTQDIYTKLKLHNYPNKPQIIYLKEYEELNHLYSLIYTLFEVFRIQGKRSVKVLQLFDSVNSNRIKTVPDYYTVIENGYLLKDIVTNDFLCKIGDYTNILDSLLTNRSNLDVLIIVDCKSYNDTVIGGSFLQFNMCRNVKHLELFGLIPENSIINNCEDEETYLTWNHIDGYDDFEDNDKRFLFLSSQPIIQKMLELSQIFQESV